MRSWGGLPQQPQTEISVNWPDQVTSALVDAGLPVGCGRSYGDSGLAASGKVLQTRGLSRFISFDSDRGVLCCEAGVTLGEILQLVVPRGWILPVLPGTRFVTVGGAIANDVHGKNHDTRGSFGCYVQSLLLQRSDGQCLTCSEAENPDWFAATIAGLGLTGVIMQAELQLQPISGGWLQSETIKFDSLDEFFSLYESSDHEYKAAWVDCLSRDTRGHLTLADHDTRAGTQALSGPGLSVPITPPLTPVNRFTLKLFNELYFQRQLSRRAQRQVPMYGWFFPLDGVGQWNRLYGRRGFRQYQCVVPREGIVELLRLIRLSGQGSFLAVLKGFGARASPGWLSFPRPGYTLALDFPWRDEHTTRLFTKLDDVVMASGGAVYPAKDAHMSPALFRRAYPRWEAMQTFRDPQFKSLFWQRVTEDS
jgi:FAD/FMN-containing dehydrogenase